MEGDTDKDLFTIQLSMIADMIMNVLQLGIAESMNHINAWENTQSLEKLIHIFCNHCYS